VLEIIVKFDLEEHLAKTEALPNTQFGFRKALNTAALATAHAKWLEAEQRGKVVGVLGFDLSAAFDTVNQLQLLPKLGKLGLLAHSLMWNGTESEFLPVEYGVRQGSILGPILYLVLVADITSCVGIGNEDNSGYADDFFLWAVGDSLEGGRRLLQIAGGNGLVLNAAKTQLMIGATPRKRMFWASPSTSGASRCTHSMKLIPHNINIAKAAAKRAALISRLAVHIPRGKYLRQLAKGLMIGKISYAAAAVTIPRLDNECKGPNSAHRAIQVAINDAARSIVGCKRRDHIHVHDLLERAGLPSLNEVAAKAVALETWKCFYSNDGGGGARNP
ncbi:Rna-directed dna polymerase from mobile element jockey-like protein, partial [Caligus rogercresseyi]